MLGFVTRLASAACGARLSTLAGMPSSTRGQKRKLLAVAALATGAADYASAAQICELCQLQHSVFTRATADGLLQHAIQTLGSQFVCTGRVPFFFPDTWMEMELSTGYNSATHLVMVEREVTAELACVVDGLVTQMVG